MTEVIAVTTAVAVRLPVVSTVRCQWREWGTSLMRQHTSLIVANCPQMAFLGPNEERPSLARMRNE
jgi:hypothetical protein